MLAARQAPQPCEAGLAKGKSGWPNRSRGVILAVGRLNFLSVADLATAHACYKSEEYRLAKLIRQRHAETDFVIVDGA
jgi:uncharacterized protein (DUF1330 family)